MYSYEKNHIKDEKSSRQETPTNGLLLGVISMVQINIKDKEENEFL